MHEGPPWSTSVVTPERTPQRSPRGRSGR
jgi:hypothetical protein